MRERKAGQTVCWTYASPLGTIFLTADEVGLTGLAFAGQKGFSWEGNSNVRRELSPILDRSVTWLDGYFSGKQPGELPPLHLVGTEFQKLVWSELLEIPYGETTSYGALARRVAQRMGKPRMSAQAVGGAVGRNPVSVLVPCHRVVGSNGSLTGYAGGLERKQKLLTLEQAGRVTADRHE